jgi:hypothetical protein
LAVRLGSVNPKRDISVGGRDTAKAKSAYDDLLTLWQNANAEIPVLKQARAEYARLR